nr:hypothetical protein [Tanacetum cinerariifolium]
MHNDIMTVGSKEHPPMLAPEFPIEGDNSGQLRVVYKETYLNTSLENRKLISDEVKAIHMIVNGIRDNIYFTVDACPNAREMWLSIERLQQEESINKQDVKTQLFWIF